MTTNDNGLSRHPVVVVLGIIGSIIAILAFVGYDNIYKFIGGPQARPISSVGPTKAPDCSETREIGPWLTPSEVIFNPDRDGWVQADFWLSIGQLISGYDEVSVIFEPSLRVTISDVQGIAWHYNKSLWDQKDVEWCTQKHVDDSWNIRRKRLIIVTPAELCSILPCR